MASIIERNGRWRALVRRSGLTRCASFSTRSAAKQWAATVERQAEELKASGVMQPAGLTLANLIDRYTQEFYPKKKWGRSKSADLARITKDLGSRSAASLSPAAVKDYFRKRQDEGAGPVVINAQLGYLIGVVEVARAIWSLDVPLAAMQDVRTAFAKQGIVGKSKKRDRRVSDAEIAAMIAAVKKYVDTPIPMRDVIEFCVASAMRISEVCRLEWADLNETDKTIVIADRKHPTEKIGNNQTVPLLNATGFDAFEIIKRQPRRGARIFPYSAATIGTYISGALAESEDLEDLHLHDLRHEAISRLFAAGYRIEQVALVSGHRDWAMLKRYTHVRATDLHRPVKTSQ